MRGHVIDWNKQYRKCKRTRKISSFFCWIFAVFDAGFAIVLMCFGAFFADTWLIFAKNSPTNGKRKRRQIIAIFALTFELSFVMLPWRHRANGFCDTKDLTYAKNISNVKKTNYIVPKVLRHQGLDIRKITLKKDREECR